MSNNVQFEGKERRMAGIEACMKEYGIKDLEDARDICLAKGIDVDAIVKGVQPIAFDNAGWAYTLGCAVAIKKGITNAADAAEDYAADLKSGSYNPFVCMSDGKALTPEEKEGIRCAAMLELKYLADAVSELDFTGYATIEGIVKNILYLGLPKRIEFLGDTGKDVADRS